MAMAVASRAIFGYRPSSGGDFEPDRFRHVGDPCIGAEHGNTMPGEPIARGDPVSEHAYTELFAVFVSPAILEPVCLQAAQVACPVFVEHH
jgi:hypothetical protein